ncbi:hypothetical protein CICRMM096B_03005 [Citrobacter cronae]
MERQAGNGKNMDEIATPPRYVMDIPILKFISNHSIKFNSLILKRIKHYKFIHI